MTSGSLTPRSHEFEFSFRHLSRHPHIRAEFINERAEQILNGWRQFAQTKPEEFCGYENVVPTFAKKETDWLRYNLEAVIEFSEHRLNQVLLGIAWDFERGSGKISGCGTPNFMSDCWD